MARILLIDNSNSYTKLAVSEGIVIGEPVKLPTPSLSVALLHQTLETLSFDATVLASVVPAKAAVLREALGGRPLLEVQASLDLGIGIDYPEPASIGADRLANAVAAAALAGFPSVVVDFGTALTFDILSKEGNYVGGVIAPGLEAMSDYLNQRTALLPRIALAEPPGILGKSTQHAMLAGAVYGYRGLVKEILLQIQKSLNAGADLKVLATGGYADLIAAGVPGVGKVIPLLTLEGLRLIGERHFTQSRFQP